MNDPRDVLVVDDDPDMVDVLVLLLEQAGYAARSANNGREALEAVDRRRPALVLLDMLMPVMDGWAFADALRSRQGHNVPIVVLSAAEHVRARAAEIGADDALPKPFERAELLWVVGRFV